MSMCLEGGLDQVEETLKVSILKAHVHSSVPAFISQIWNSVVLSFRVEHLYVDVLKHPLFSQC